MNHQSHLDYFKNWKTSSCVKGQIPVTWSDDDLQFNWVETIQTKEVPRDDIWPGFATDQKFYLEEIHSRWKIPDQSTQHYMALEPNLPNNFKTIFDSFKDKDYSYNFLKLTPGHMLVWHFDTYATFVRRNNISHNDTNKIKRTAILLNDWTFGQSIQIGNDVVSHWSKGDTITWQSYVWHGAANYGAEDLIIAQVSYLDE